MKKQTKKGSPKTNEPQEAKQVKKPFVSNQKYRSYDGVVGWSTRSNPDHDVP